MAVAAKDRLRNLMASEVGSDAWQKAALELEKVFNRLDEEDQAVAVKHLADAGEAGADSLTRIDARGQAELPARVAVREALAALGRPIDEELNRRLRQWLILCESGTDCNADDFFSLPPEEQAVVADHLAHWLRSDLLSRLVETAPDKTAGKLVKKALHRARSSGAAAIAAQTGGGGFVLPEREEYLDEAYLSPPDASGVSFIYLYRTVFGRNTMFVVIAGDTDGIIKFEAFEVPEPKFRRMLEATRKNPHAVVARADSGYVRRLIHRSEENGRRAGKSLPPEYLRTRRALGILDEPDRPHPIFKHFEHAALKRETGLVDRSGELAEHRVFADWQLFPVVEGAFLFQLETAKQSPIQLTEAQQREREEAIYEEEVGRILDHAGRVTWSERLLQTAYIMYLIQDEAEARMTAAVAVALEDKERKPRLLIELLRRTVATMLSDGNGKGPAPDRGGIVAL